jgi:beta-glucanase (GH16 family)
MRKMMILVRGFAGLCLPLLTMLSLPTLSAAASSPTWLAFGTISQSVPTGSCALVQIVAENSLLRATPVKASTSVALTASGAGIGFYSDAACTIPNSGVVIPAGSSSGNAFISGSKQGYFLLSMRAAGFATGTELVTVTAPPAAPCSGTQIPPSMPPAQAAVAGFSKLVFDDEFNSTRTISPDNSGNYNWYTFNPFSSSFQLPLSALAFKNGCLTITNDLSGFSYGLGTIKSNNSTAGTFQHGYFEARMQFNPSGSQGGSWPAFWSNAIEDLEGKNPYDELDFVEAYTGDLGLQGDSDVTLVTTLHQFAVENGGTVSVQQPNDIPVLPTGFNYSAFHIYGCLWSTNSVTWYIDNKPVMTVATGPGTSFDALEQDHLYLVLGTGANWPVAFDYVRVWH